MNDDRPATLHDRILADVRDNIVRGIWPPGYRIPFETDMATEYGVSRMTVNKALTQLTREGYLERRRKLGTFVTAPRVQSAVMEIANIGEEIRDTGRAYSLSILSREVRHSTPADMQLLHLEHPVRLLALDSVHMADTSPFCHEARLINLDAVPAAETTDFEGESAGAWLMRQVPWSAAEHKIRAISASAAEARVLAIKAGGACLEICRLTEFEGRPITFARLIYPGDKHQLVAQFSPHALPGS